MRKLKCVRPDLSAKINSETHARNDRAGFSVIALSSDQVGLELGFWADKIWAQNDSPLFTHGEEASFDTTTQHMYDLAILGGQYKLLADNAAILTGSLRNYSGSGPPYSTPNFLFLGDDTTSASASVSLARVDMFSFALPEPSSLVLLALGSTLAFGVIRRRS